jgi:hypothetical protein
VGELSQAAPEDWMQLVDVARFEGLEGLLYRHCATAGLEIPSQYIPQLKLAYRQVAEQNCVALAKLEELLRAAASDGLEVLVLPGASLMPLYPDVGCRPMDDIDLLVSPGQMSAAGTFLRACGFEPVQCHEGLYTNEGLTLDLHTDLVNGDRIQARSSAAHIDMSEVWDNARVQATAELTALTLCLEDALLYTSLHALRHSFRRLTWFVDFHLLMKAQPDWQVVEHKVRRNNATKSLHYCLHYLENHLSIPVPRALTTADFPALGLVESFLLQQLSRTRPESEWGEVLWSFSCKGIAGKVSFLREFLFPRPEVLMQVFPRLPVVLIPLAYGLRAFQLLLRGSRQLGMLAKSR